MWMRETRSRLFMQMELEMCTDDLPWIIICYLSAFNDYPVRVLYTDAFASFIKLEKRA